MESDREQFAKANSTAPLAPPHTRSGDVGSVAADADGEMCDPTSLAAVTSAIRTDGAGAGGAGAPQAAAAAAAQAGGRFHTDAELAAAAASPTAAAAAATLRDRVDALIAAARAAVGDVHPGIFDAGGGLHPPFRAVACWRDCWHFFRVASYAVAGGRGGGTGRLTRSRR